MKMQIGPVKLQIELEPEATRAILKGIGALVAGMPGYWWVEEHYKPETDRRSTSKPRKPVVPRTEEEKKTEDKKKPLAPMKTSGGASIQVSEKLPDIEIDELKPMLHANFTQVADIFGSEGKNRLELAAETMADSPEALELFAMKLLNEGSGGKNNVACANQGDLEKICGDFFDEDPAGIAGICGGDGIEEIASLIQFIITNDHDLA